MGFLSEADFLQNTLTTIHYTGKTSIKCIAFIRAQASKAQGPLVFLRIIIIIIIIFLSRFWGVLGPLTYTKTLFLSRFWGVLGPLTYTKTLENWHTCWNLRPLGRRRDWDPGVAQGLYSAPWKTVRKQMYISHILAHIHMKLGTHIDLIELNNFHAACHWLRPTGSRLFRAA